MWQSPSLCLTPVLTSTNLRMSLSILILASCHPWSMKFIEFLNLEAFLDFHSQITVATYCESDPLQCARKSCLWSAWRGRLCWRPSNQRWARMVPYIWESKRTAWNKPFCKILFFFHFYGEDGIGVTNAIDYSLGHVMRTPDHDERVQRTYRPLSIVVDCRK